MSWYSDMRAMQEADSKETRWQNNFMGFWLCECGRVLDKEMIYCPKCGCELDWSEE